MGWLDEARTAEFLTLWKRNFVDAAQMFASAKGRSASSRAYAERGALWVEIREPFDGVRLVTLELPTEVMPPRVYLRVWTYQPEGDQIYDALDSHRYEWMGMPVARYLNERPQGSWLSQLNAAGVQVQGIRHYLDISKIDEGLEKEFPHALHEMLKSFCVHIATVATGTPAPDGPIESPLENPLRLALGADNDEIDDAEAEFKVPGQPLERLAPELQALLGLDQDPRFSHELPPVKVALANARIGQGGYRRRMLDLWGRRCALTGCTVEAVLIASHARPWSLCETAQQCLDEYNGLLLCANLDRLFDQGMIAFTDDGTVITKGDSAIDSMVTAERLRFVDPRHLPYLAWHRSNSGFS